ncbi:hypothetical protein [Cohnella thailandensis]|jgi:hypothetical protein|uniref:Uncharacterized protein n=1 Tax=Cohnella thailandensis TaxID=557557 RepID=A0A841SW63_9BACL|nr:hypothetical protein [Cohnella thailandensis]MBB6633867.1 hypothetical protein [Cohnella thailandensis]MBP1972550.1 hypothetical protein [Cohnella thailandensis]
MITIRNAEFRRILDRGGQRFAEVELDTNQASAPHLLAYFRKEGNGRYQLVRVIADDAKAKSDTDEPYVGAFADTLDVTSLLFAGPDHGALEDRIAFGYQILDFGDIRSQLDSQLR